MAGEEKKAVHPAAHPQEPKQERAENVLHQAGVAAGRSNEACNVIVSVTVFRS